MEKMGLLGAGKVAAKTTEVAELSAEQKAVVALTKQITEKTSAPRNDLMIASGQVGLNKPYRAPIYQTYLECIQGLYRQGILGFYKGNGCRLAHIFFYGVVNNNILYFLDTDEKIFKRSSFWVNYLSATVASMFLHPLHFAEARMVLNNRIPQFNSYKSLWTLFMSTNT